MKFSIHKRSLPKHIKLAKTDIVIIMKCQSVPDKRLRDKIHNRMHGIMWGVREYEGTKQGEYFTIYTDIFKDLVTFIPELSGRKCVYFGKDRANEKDYIIFAISSSKRKKESDALYCCLV